MFTEKMESNLQGTRNLADLKKTCTKFLEIKIYYYEKLGEYGLMVD